MFSDLTFLHVQKAILLGNMPNSIQSGGLTDWLVLIMAWHWKK